jgi:hypothetical protein
MTRLLLVHIAKTGGTSLRRLFKSTRVLCDFDCFHNGSLLRFRDGQRVSRGPLDPASLTHYDVALVMMRHPLSRLKSCHRYFLAGGLNQSGKGVFPQDTTHQHFLQQRAPNLAECCQWLPEIAERIPHFRPACHWLDPLPNPLADRVVCGQQEHFDEELQRLFQLLDLDPRSLRVEHRNTSPPKTDEPWDSQSIRLAEHFYAADFQRFGYERTPQPEPRLIQYWDQSSPPPQLLSRMKRWKELHPSWRYQRYHRQSAAQFIGSNYGPALKEAFLDIRLPAMQADVFRIAALQSQAAVWVDAATQCHQPLERWLDRRRPLVMLRRSHQQHPKICSCLVHSAAPGHPLLVAAWQLISAALLARRGERVYRDFGPGVLRDLLASGAPEAGLQVLPESELVDQLSIGSSSDVLPSHCHWSKRQQEESLYLSGGSPSASQRSNEAS